MVKIIQSVDEFSEVIAQVRIVDCRTAPENNKKLRVS